MSQPFSLPIRELARREHVSPTKLYRLIDDGTLESVLEGHRRRVFVGSWEGYLLRLAAEQRGGTFKLPSTNPKIRTNLGGKTVSNPIAYAPRSSSDRHREAVGANNKGTRQGAEPKLKGSRRATR